MLFWYGFFKALLSFYRLLYFFEHFYNFFYNFLAWSIFRLPCLRCLGCLRCFLVEVIFRLRSFLVEVIRLRCFLVETIFCLRCLLVEVFRLRWMLILANLSHSFLLAFRACISFSYWSRVHCPKSYFWSFFENYLSNLSWTVFNYWIFFYFKVSFSLSHR